MVYDQPTQVTLECPQCRSYKTVPRPKDIPFTVRVIELLCPECVDETELHIERWFSSPGIEVPHDLRDPDRLREDRDERRFPRGRHD